MITLIDLLAMLFTAPYAFNVGTTEGKKTYLTFWTTEINTAQYRIVLCLR